MGAYIQVFRPASRGAMDEVNSMMCMCHTRYSPYQLMLRQAN